MLKSSIINTSLGEMITISDENYVYLLEFTDSKRLTRKIKKLQCVLNLPIKKDITEPIEMMKSELESYFNGFNFKFNTPILQIGTGFQIKAWRELNNIPYGSTKTYLDHAKAVGAPKACRAIANANGDNLLAIIVPCHRITGSNGNLGGYAGGVARKLWLIDHEKKSFKLYT